MKLQASARLQATTELLAGKYADFFKTMNLGVAPAVLEKSLLREEPNKAIFKLKRPVWDTVQEALRKNGQVKELDSVELPHGTGMRFRYVLGPSKKINLLYQGSDYNEYYMVLLNK